MYCKNCGSEINENQKFCPKCGNVIESKSKLPENIELNSTNKRKFPIWAVIVAIILVIVIIVTIFFVGHNKTTPYQDFIASNQVNIYERDNYTYSIKNDNYNYSYKFSEDVTNQKIISAYEINDTYMITVSMALDKQLLIVDLFRNDGDEYIKIDSSDLDYVMIYENILEHFAIFKKADSDSFVFINQFKFTEELDEKTCHSNMIAFAIENDEIKIKSDFLYACEIDDFGDSKGAIETKSWYIEDYISKDSAENDGKIGNDAESNILYDAEYEKKSLLLDSADIYGSKDYLNCSKDVSVIENDNNVVPIFKGSISADNSNGTISFKDFTELSNYKA